MRPAVRETASPRRRSAPVAHALADVVALPPSSPNWNSYVRHHRDGLEFMGLPCPAANLGFPFLQWPSPATRVKLRARARGERTPIPNLSLLDWRRPARHVRARRLPIVRPVTWADCQREVVAGPGDWCPYVSCRHHLYLEVDDAGKIKLNFPGKEPWELAETCSLKVATTYVPRLKADRKRERGGEERDEEDTWTDRADGRERSLPDVAKLINAAPQRVWQLEQEAMQTIRATPGGIEAFLGMTEDLGS